MKKHISKPIKNFIKKIDRQSPYPLFHPIAMTKKEVSLLLGYARKAKGYLEFGSGGSTFLVSKKTNTPIVSVESSSDWIDFLKEYLLIRNRVKSGQIKFHLVDIGETKKWGYPVSDEKKQLYPEYSGGVFNSLEIIPDFVFVDGRFRVACVLQSIFKLWDVKGLKIAIHDYKERSYYHVIEKYLDRVDSIDSLYIFSLNKDALKEDVLSDYDKYKSIPE